MSGNVGQNSLFRPEAVRHRFDALFGSIMIPTDRYVSVISILIAGFLVVLVLFLVFGQYTKKTPVHGWLEYSPGEAQVRSTRTGFIEQIFVRDGMRVERGQQLLVISASRASTSSTDVDRQLLDQLESEKQSLSRRIQAQDSLFEQRVAAARQAEAVLQGRADKLALLKEVALGRLKIAEAENARVEKTVAVGLLPRAQLDQAQDSVLTAKLAIEEINQRITDTLGAISAKRSELASLPVESQQAVESMKAEISRLDQRVTDATSQQDAIVVAPISGTVATMTAKVGQSVIGNSPLLAIVPEGAVIQARLLIPTRSAGFVAEGLSVNLRYDAFPYQKFGSYLGTIRYIDKMAIPASDDAWPTRVSEPSYLTVIQLESQAIKGYGRELPLRAGMTVQASVLEDRRRLIEWLFEPALSVSGKL